jgi:hypothetical protein
MIKEKFNGIQTEGEAPRVIIVKGKNSPASPTLKLRDLNGSDPPCPWLGGAPGWKKLVKLLPTFQTKAAPSSRETVTKRRPSGEKLHAASPCL